MGLTKILPSPIWPVLVAAPDRRDDGFDLLVADDDFDAQLRQETHDIFGAAIDFCMALLPAIAFGLDDGHAVDVEAASRFSRTSSSLKGLMMAVMSFMVPAK